MKYCTECQEEQKWPSATDMVEGDCELCHGAGPVHDLGDNVIMFPIWERYQQIMDEMMGTLPDPRNPIEVFNIAMHPPIPPEYDEPADIIQLEFDLYANEDDEIEPPLV